MRRYLKAFISSVLLLCLFFEGSISILPVAAASSTGGDDEAYYLVDEDFLLTGQWYYQTSANSSLNGLDTAQRMNNGEYSWDILEKGGTIYNYDSSKGYIPVVLSDTSTTESIIINKTFEEQTSGKMIVEYRTQFSTLAKGYGVSLGDGDTVALKLEINKTSKVFFKFNTKNLTSYTLSADTEYGIRFEIDLDAKTADLFINGALMAENIALTADKINNIRAYTPAATTGDMGFTAVRVMRGYHFADSFVAYAPGHMPTGADDLWTATGYPRAVTDYAGIQMDIYSLILEDVAQAATGGSVYVERDIDPVTGKVIFSFKVYSEAAINNLNIVLGGFKSNITNGTYYVETPSGDVAVKELRSDLWHDFRITLDLDNSTADVQIDGKKVKTGIQFASGSTTPELIGFYTGNETTDTIYLDDIFVYNAPVQDEYYPSEPAKLKKDDDDVIVGMQVCDLWREGKHYGWEYINRYPSRKSYLGYYDDGNIEAKDWEIKYMVEHGVDFALHCWFKPSGVGYNIKDPRYAAYSLDAYFNSQYKDKLDFAIMWENSSYGLSANNPAAVLADFKENIVPYWIEYYFKDPNYLKVDGKVFLSIYKLDTFVKSLSKDADGDTVYEDDQYVFDAIKYLNDEVAKAGIDGVDGVYLTGIIGDINAVSSAYQGTWKDSSGAAYYDTFQDYQYYGFDAVYFYSYSIGHTTLGRQWNKLLGAENNTANNVSGLTISHIPTISMGRDGEAWAGTDTANKGYYLTSDSLTELCTKVKDNFIDTKTENTADRMVLLDNWNEFGEGHFFMPTNVAGFDYLEAVGSVFGMPAHTDEKPRYVERLGHLYDDDRVVETKETELRWRGALKDITTGDYKWEFTSDVEGWTGSNLSVGFWDSLAGKDGLSVSGGALTGTGRSSDPMIKSPDNLGLVLQGNEVVHVRFRNGSGAASTQIFFTTTDSTSFSETNSSWVYCVPTNMSSGEYVDVYYDFSTVANGAALAGWEKGKTLKQIRIDPFNAASAFAYDLIEIVRYDDTAPVVPVFEGEITYDDANSKAVYSFTNPNYSLDCMAYAAEFEGNKLTEVYVSEQHTIPVGDISFSIPMEIESGKTYQFGVWDYDMNPIIPALNM